MAMKSCVEETHDRGSKGPGGSAGSTGRNFALNCCFAPQSEADKVFASLDVNGDGVISRNEWMKAYGQAAALSAPAASPSFSLPPVSMAPPASMVT